MNQHHIKESEHAPSYYAASVMLPARRPTLEGSIEADVCVIGAGYTGLSTALHLLEAGLKVVILERARVGWGASGRNGGQVVHSFSRDVDVIEKSYGAEVAHAFASMMFEGGKIIRDRVAKYDIDCDLKNGGVFAAFNSKKAKELVAQQRLWEHYGHRDLTFVDAQSDIRKIINTSAYTALLIDQSGGHLHPLKLALGEALAAEKLGGIIFEESAVTRIERGKMHRVKTNKGEVNAPIVIIACNAYIGDLEPQLSRKAISCGTQIIATTPLGQFADELIPSDYCVEDNNFLLDYYRLSADKRLIFGGGVNYGARNPKHIASKILPNLRKIFPQCATVNVEYAWSGNFSLTLSRLPDVGRLAPTIYYSQGCSGHGLTFTHLIGRVLSEAVCGQAQRFSVFERVPHRAFPGGAALRIPATALGAFWHDMRDRLGV